MAQFLLRDYLSDNGLTGITTGGEPGTPGVDNGTFEQFMNGMTPQQRFPGWVNGADGSGYSLSPDGQYVNVPDKYLSSNMNKDGFLGFDWGDMMGPGMLLAGPFAGMMSGIGAGAGLGAGLGSEASALTGSGGFGYGFGDIGASGVAAGGMGAGSDIYGNFDMGSGPTGTDPFTGGAAAPGASEAVQQLVQKVGPDQAKSVLGRLLSGTATSDDYLKIGGQLASTLLGVYGANRQTSQLQNLSNQFAGYGAPYRARLAESYADPAAFLKNSPDINAAVGQGTDALARSLSVQGNPAGSGHALQELQNYATTGLYGKLGQERDRLAGFGGLTAYNQAAPTAATNAVNSQAGVPNAIGAGISAITNPVKTTYQTMMDFFNQPGVA